MLLALACVLLGVLVGGAAQAQGVTRVDLRIPMAEAGSSGLEAVLVLPDLPGKHPLVLLSHGSPRVADDRKTMAADGYWPEAVAFARRGWAVALVMRRGFGTSGGSWVEGFGSCDKPDYLGAGAASVADLKATIRALADHPAVDTRRILAVGHSAGGFASVALAADPPPGLVGAISFAGGRGSSAPDSICSEASLVSAFLRFGKTARVPMLWVYAENDHFFSPVLARKFMRAFESGGGTVDLQLTPAFGADGHFLFSTAGQSVWEPLVDAFLKANQLQLLAQPLVLPQVPAPVRLTAKQQEAFTAYSWAGNHRAFAVSPEGAFGWRSGQKTADQARTEALANCNAHAKNDCEVISADGKSVR
jgi:dienelactone hydrolase